MVSGDGGEVFLDNADNDVYMIPSELNTYAWETIFYDYGAEWRPGSAGWETYLPGMSYNNNIDLDLTDYAG